jgi:hypothetical protein
MAEPTIYETMQPHPDEMYTIADLSLTDNEREIIAWLAAAGDKTRDKTRDTKKTLTPVMRATLRGLLERLG